MREDFLHYLWKHKKINPTNLSTSLDEAISIISVGTHNLNSGPDFFNAQLRIDNQLWAGNVEIHIKSSDWYVHKHETDSAYDNVILHVVWEHDTDIYREDNSVIPTLQLKDVIDTGMLLNYKRLFNASKTWINCENDFASVSDFTVSNWLERLYVERLEEKSLLIQELLASSNNDWEAVLFKMLAKNFGLKVNGESFLSLAQSFDFKVLRKLKSNPEDIEALFFGQTGLLIKEHQDDYHSKLEEQYSFLVSKFKLDNAGVLPLKFFRLRPSNFPTIRLSQLASLYATKDNLFSNIINLNTKDDFYKVFNVSALHYWNTHYSFGKTSKASQKILSRSFINLLIVNTIIPLKFCYSKSQGKSIEDDIINLIKQLPLEQNSIVKRFNHIKPLGKSALESQSLLQLKTQYCNKHNCLKCAIGNSLING
ncbi:DUF2851 family protein [Ichthyenterobacterium sp. W332]|uniref:DUF2851 family protein n=1 Tax=Microcosmobacter mediterraneus TaxID=3075607 RepID=A0ABU2YN43_9FLAO|nr:DUF2851 family protein [Ichthyenterobacterium sp. W332]MDT0559583.1 DUF2851 family protein [Ichthyenterobacterium sp. W332]